MTEVASALSLEGLTCRYGGVVAVDDLTVTVDAGSFHAVIGPNGAGKTTLANLLTGITRPYSGAVLLDGARLPADPGRVRRLGVARTFQNNRLFPRLVVEDHLFVALLGTKQGGWVPARREERTMARFRDDKRLTDRVNDTLRVCRLEGVRRQRVGDLPYGVQKRVEFARAVVTAPTLLLLDEPAAGLNTDEKSEFGDVVEMVRELRKCTVVLIEHDMAVVRRLAESVSVLDFGKLLVTGPTEAVLADERVIRVYVGNAAV